MSVWHLIDHVWFTYFVPSLYGNGPEALVQTVVYGIIAMGVYPPLRHAAEREAKHLHAKLDKVVHHQQGLSESHAAIHDKLDALLGNAKSAPPKDSEPGTLA